MRCVGVPGRCGQTESDSDGLRYEGLEVRYYTWLPVKPQVANGDLTNPCSSADWVGILALSWQLCLYLGIQQIIITLTAPRPDEWLWKMEGGWTMGQGGPERPRLYKSWGNP